MKTNALLALLAVAVMAPWSSRAEEAAPDPQAVLRAADHILAPPGYRAQVEMVAHRPDGTKRAYAYRVFKSGNDKLLLTFDSPGVLSGHSVLRKGDDLWRYLPSLKRAMRISSRSDFEAGDFRNADVLRVNLAADYEVEKMTRDGEHWVLDLKAKTPEAAYDKARMWVRVKDNMPIREELYASSGKLLRTLECAEPKDFGGHLAPSVLRMRNEVAKGRYTVMTVKELTRDDGIPGSRFQVESMGR